MVWQISITNFHHYYVIIFITRVFHCFKLILTFIPCFVFKVKKLQFSFWKSYYLFNFAEKNNMSHWTIKNFSGVITCTICCLTAETRKQFIKLSLSDHRWKGANEDNEEELDFEFEFKAKTITKDNTINFTKVKLNTITEADTITKGKPKTIAKDEAIVNTNNITKTDIANSWTALQP